MPKPDDVWTAGYLVLLFVAVWITAVAICTFAYRLESIRYSLLQKSKTGSDFNSRFVRLSPLPSLAQHLRLARSVKAPR